MFRRCSAWRKAGYADDPAVRSFSTESARHDEALQPIKRAVMTRMNLTRRKKQTNRTKRMKLKKQMKQKMKTNQTPHPKHQRRRLKKHPLQKKKTPHRQTQRNSRVQKEHRADQSRNYIFNIL
nr:hypothetical protein [Bacillus velezensis]